MTRYADQSPPLESLTEDREAQIFWRLRLRIAQARLHQLLATARLRTSLVAGLSLFFWCGLFWLFYEGFDFLTTFVGRPGGTYHADTVHLVFHLFFASLNIMLIFSAAIIIYSGLFNSGETEFLLTLPGRAERILLHKLQEAVFYSSWGFFLLASPMMIAYGFVVGAPAYYYVLLLPLIVSFVYIPCTLGALSCLAIVRWLPRLRRLVVAGAALIVILVAFQSIWHTLRTRGTPLFGADWFQQTLQRFRFTQQQWLPSSWLSGGLLQAARSPDTVTTDLPWLDSGMYLVLLISSALLCHIITVWAGKRMLRDCYSGLITRQARRRTVVSPVLDRAVDWLLIPFSTQVRLLLVKDLRLFRRDPVQWSQFLIFFGLLGLYFLNAERFSSNTHDINLVTWVNMVSFLNLAVVGLILSTFTTRFVYPMISLEGNRFWILGLLPLSRDTILWSKFLFAALGSWIPCTILIFLSDMMLGVSQLVVIMHQLTCVLLCLGLASIAVGLGATLPNLREESPSKIAAGFGGTLNLVLSALYIMIIVLLTALPCHFYLIAQVTAFRPQMPNADQLRIWLAAGAIASTLLGTFATVVPLRSGLRAFRELEF